MIIVRQFDPTSPDFSGAIAVYRSYANQDEDAAKSYFGMYAGRADYAGFVAVMDHAVVGMCFGAKVTSGNWWFDAVTKGLASFAPQLEQAWTLNELGVLPVFQRLGIARRLLEAVTGAVRWPHLVLSTGIENLPARELYRKMGWIELGSVALSKTGKPSVVYLLERKQPINESDRLVQSALRAEA